MSGDGNIFFFGGYIDDIFKSSDSIVGHCVSYCVFRVKFLREKFKGDIYMFLSPRKTCSGEKI